MERNGEDVFAGWNVDLISTKCYRGISFMEEKNKKLATFAGGCFWCLESAFRDMKGVIRVMSGYTGGTIPNPSYQDVCEGGTGHVEAVEIEYDESVVSYEELLERYWLNVDPTDNGGQFVDRGSQYRTVIFVHSKEQKEVVEESKRKLGLDTRFKKPIVTEVKNASIFYPAEEYHQEYDKKFPGRYKLYVWGSGRLNGLEKLWSEGQVNARMEITKIEEDLKNELENENNKEDLLQVAVEKNELETKDLVVGIEEEMEQAEAEIEKRGLEGEKAVDDDFENKKVEVEDESDVEKVTVVRFGEKNNREISEEKNEKKSVAQNDKKVKTVENLEDKKKLKNDYKEKIAKLNSMQRQVTQECGTEPPFGNEYWDEKREGIYVDVVSGDVLFSSKDKYDSGTGWPSFTAPMVSDNVIENQDDSGFIKRIEVKSARSGSHLGHVFGDGPSEKGGMRYCINSAALRFIPKEELEKEGYGAWTDKC